MKNKRISTRVLAVFAAVLLIMTLSVPTFAATSYTFHPPESGDSYTEEFLLPSGLYHIKSTFSYGGKFYSLYTEAPISISYGEVDFMGDRSDSAFLVNIPLNVESDVFQDADHIELFGVTISYEGISRSSLYPSIGGTPVAYLGATIEFIPVERSISLSDYLPVDALPAVFNEIVTLLPLALGTLVGFIAIRKAIAYLQNFLHSS